MKQISLTGKIKNVNFDFNATYSSPKNDIIINENNANEEKLLNKKSYCSSPLSSSSAAAAVAASKSKSSTSGAATKRKFGRSGKLKVHHQQGQHQRRKQKQQKQEEEEEEEINMPSHRRKVRNVEQRRKMKLHNRKDDIPDCDTLEIIDYDENAAEQSFAKPNPDFYSDLSSEDDTTPLTSTPKSKSKKSGKSPLLFDVPSTPLLDPLETRISLTDASNLLDNNNNDDDRSFKSCVTSSASGASSSKYGDYNSSSALSTTTAGGTSSSRTRRGKRHRSTKKRRRSEKPSIILKFAKTLMENLGQAVTDFFMFLCSLLKIDGGHSGNRATPASCLLLLVGTYLFISYIEVSFAGMVEILFEWLWPSIHICLRMIERFFKGIGNAFAGLDDLAESSYCDMASMWCDFFNLMCSSRCSFTKFALERIRG